MLLQDLRDGAQQWHDARNSRGRSEALRQLTWAVDDLLCTGMSAAVVHQTLLDEQVPDEIIVQLLSP